MSEMKQWVRYNHLTDTYDTPDGTAVAAELVDNTKCYADFIYIAGIREQQRAALSKAAPKGEESNHG